jgi:predicted enzyme related to lactoylglutathione lyase
MALEVVQLPVSDIDRAKRFSPSLGWRFDIDLTLRDFGTAQVTPPHSACSNQFGRHRTNAEPGSAQGRYLVAADIHAAREDLVRRGVEVSEVSVQVPPGLGGSAGRSYLATASSSDPDGNSWVLRRQDQ